MSSRRSSRNKASKRGLAMSQLTQTNARELRVTTQCSPYGILEPENVSVKRGQPHERLTCSASFRA